MKRLLPVILIILLLLLNSCAVGPPFETDTVGTSVAQTLTAVSWTAMPTPTFNPNIPNIVNWMNNDLSTINPLESTLDAEYHVLNLTFPNIEGGSNLRFQLDVSCMCIHSSDCCVLERTFVVAIESMKRYPGLSTLVPGEVSEVVVVCSDHQTQTKIGAISAPWQDVKAYLLGNISGYQLGARARQIVAP